MTMLSQASASIPFRSPESALGALGPDPTARAIAAASDAALIVDADGVVRDLSVGSVALAQSAIAGWLDRPWFEAVASDSVQKAEELLQDAKEGKASRWRELNHPTRNGGNLPMRWFAVPSDDRGRVLVVGRDLQAVSDLQQRLLQVQQSMERDYVRLRQAETRWRLLFQTSPEPVLVVDAAGRRVREANPAALRLVGAAEADAIGRRFEDLLASESRDAAERLFAGVAASTVAELTLRDGTRRSATGSSFRQDGAGFVIVHFAGETDLAGGASDAERRLAAALERIPDAFVVTDRSLRVLAANLAFVEATEAPDLQALLGETLDRFVGRPQVDLKVVVGQLEEHGVVRNLQTVVRGLYRGPEEVELSAVAVPDGDPPSYGFSLRNIARRLGPASSVAEPRSVEQMTQLIGRVPMRDIVRESTDLIERLCIEAALDLTGNNRASAADLLGLSRQSLYLKLRRYGVIGADAPEE